MKSAFIIVCCLCAFFICSTIIFERKNFADHKIIAQKDNQIQQQLDEITKLKAASISKPEGEMQQDQTTLVCGIYEFNKAGSGWLKIDLRSDGTAISSLVYWDGGQEINRKTIRWTLNGNKVLVGNSGFKIEGDDLIDSQGNRWLRIR